MAVVIMSRRIRGRLYFVLGPVAFPTFDEAADALAALEADLAGGVL